MPEVTIEQWAVIRIEGAGHIEVVAHDRENAMLRYCWHRVSKDASFDFKAWWRENAKKKHHKGKVKHGVQQPVNRVKPGVLLCPHKLAAQVAQYAH